MMDTRTWIERYALCPFMRFWQDMLDSFNSDGGHILLLVLLFFWFRGDASMEKYAGEVMGALLMYLKMVGSNKTRRDTPAPEPTEETIP
jgi:hypothetical protein